jgi:hypothetical protein
VGVVPRAPLVAAASYGTCRADVAVPERCLRYRAQRERFGTEIACLFGKGRCRPTVCRSRGELAEVTGCLGQERAGLRTDNVKVAGMAKPLVFLQEPEHLPVIRPTRCSRP